jgi:uncharacterized protein DUF3179
MWIRSAFKFAQPSRAQWLIGVLVAAAVGGVALYFTQPQAPSPASLQSGARDSLSSDIKTIIPVDAIRAVDHPRFITAEKASKAGFYDRFPVIGVELGGESHAYPIGFLSQVEIVNDRLGGKNIAVTW